MPVDLEQQILNVLRGKSAEDRPTTFGDFARRFGVSANLIASCAQQMVDKELALPSTILVHGTTTLHGLLPRPPVSSPSS